MEKHQARLGDGPGGRGDGGDRRGGEKAFCNLSSWIVSSAQTSFRSQETAANLGSVCACACVCMRVCVFLDQITELSSEVADERNTGESASQLLETETSERLRLEKDMKELQVGRPRGHTHTQDCFNWGFN